MCATSVVGAAAAALKGLERDKNRRLEMERLRYEYMRRSKDFSMFFDDVVPERPAAEPDYTPKNIRHEWIEMPGFVGKALRITGEIEGIGVFCIQETMNTLDILTDAEDLIISHAVKRFFAAADNYVQQHKESKTNPNASSSH